MKLKILIPIILTSCTSSFPPLFPGYVPSDLTNRASMPFLSDGKTYNGTGVLQRKSSQDILFVLPKNTLKLMITTCSREDFFPYPDTAKPFKYNYIPVMYVENLESCILRATAITNKGEIFNSVIDFTAGEELIASLSCNGKTENTVGVGLCQTRKNLVQNIEFKEPTVYAMGEGCPDPQIGFISTSYDFKVKSGFCTYQFMSKNKKVYRLTTYGYETIDEIKVTP